MKNCRTVRNVIFIFWSLAALCVSRSTASSLSGTAVNTDLTPVYGAVIYGVTGKACLLIDTNILNRSELLSRTRTDRNGEFQLECTEAVTALVVQDIAGRWGYAAVTEPSGPVQIVLETPSSLTGTCYRGTSPAGNENIVAVLLTDAPALQYRFHGKSAQDGTFSFQNMMPGLYEIKMIREVPPLGCCFREVIVKQKQIDLPPGGAGSIQLGGTDKPLLKGTITDSSGNALHGVWVQLFPNDVPAGLLTNIHTQGDSVWADVTDRNGNYVIYDVPAGRYSVRCFRRLALNNSCRTLNTTEEVTVRENATEIPTPNVYDISIDLDRFLPLPIGRDAPDIKAVLSNGRSFDLLRQKQITILYFYMNSCCLCGEVTDRMNQSADRWKASGILVVGINLDKEETTFKAGLEGKPPAFDCLYGGPLSSSRIAAEYRVVNVPSTVIVDSSGKIAQMDLFGDVLDRFIEGLQGSNGVAPPDDAR